MLVSILCSDSTKNQTLPLIPNENLLQLKNRLGPAYAGAKFVYSGKLLADSQNLGAILKEENPNIQCFLSYIDLSSKETTADGIPPQEPHLEGASSQVDAATEPIFSSSQERTVSTVAPEFIGLPKYSTEPFATRIVIINGQKYKVETGDAIPLPDGVDVQEIRRRMSTSVLKLHLSHRNLLFNQGNNGHFGLNEQAAPLNVNNPLDDIPLPLRQQINGRPVFRLVFNVAEWGDIMGQAFKLAIAWYFVFRYLSFPRAVIASIVFSLFFLHGAGFFDYIGRIFQGNQQPPAPVVVNQPAPQAAAANDAGLPNPDPQDLLQPAAEAPPQIQPPPPQTLLGLVQAAIVGFFLSMVPEQGPQRAPEEVDNPL